MLPREWLDRFGPAIPRNVFVQAGQDAVIQANPDRYLLGFMLASQSVQILPRITGIAYGAVPNFAAGDPPLMITHALQGALVNLTWVIRGLAANSDVLVVEAFARTTVKSNGRAVPISQRPVANIRKR